MFHITIFILRTIKNSFLNKFQWTILFLYTISELEAQYNSGGKGH